MADHPVKMQAELIKELNGLPPMCAIETAFQAGADQELEACCEWIESELRGQLRPAHRIAIDLRAARRPKPPTLAEQALATLPEDAGKYDFTAITTPQLSVIRAALNRLAELEAQ
jgi:hypothetical protein